MNPRYRVPAVIGAVVLVIGLVAVLAVVLSGDDDSSSEAPGTAPSDTVESIGETLPIDLLGGALTTLPDAGSDPAVGEPAPQITGQSFDGTEVMIGGPADQPTLVVFLAHWCPHCNDEIPELLELSARGDLPAELDIVGVSTAVAADRPNFPPSQWLVDKGWPWASMADNEMSEAFLAYGGSGFPFLVLLDEDGTVIARQSGQQSADDIQAWLTEHLPDSTT